MSIELDDNDNTSIKYVNESSTSVEQDQSEEMDINTRYHKDRDKVVDSHIGDLKIEGFEMNIPGSQKHKANNRKHRGHHKKQSINSSSALLAKLKPNLLPNPIFGHKVQLKITEMPTKVTKAPILSILLNNTGPDIVGEFTKVDDVSKVSQGDDVDYSQLEGALQGYPLNSIQREALRKNWRKACDKKASKCCIKACKTTAKNAEGPKDLKRIIIKECKNSCKSFFNIRHNKDSGSDSDSNSDSGSGSGSESGSNCK